MTRQVVVSRRAVADAVLSASRGMRALRDFYLPVELIDRMAGTVFWAQSAALSRFQESGDEAILDEVPDSLTALAETAIWAKVLLLEKALNKGEPFPAARGPLRRGPSQGPRDGTLRKQKSVYLTEELTDRLRAAVYWSRSYVVRAIEETGDDSLQDYAVESASALVTEALWAEVRRVEKELNGGAAFPPARGRPKSGPGPRATARLQQPRGRRRKSD